MHIVILPLMLSYCIFHVAYLCSVLFTISLNIYLVYSYVPPFSCLGIGCMHACLKATRRSWGYRLLRRFKATHYTYLTFHSLCDNKRITGELLTQHSKT